MTCLESVYPGYAANTTFRLHGCRNKYRSTLRKHNSGISRVRQLLVETNINFIAVSIACIFSDLLRQCFHYCGQSIQFMFNNKFSEYHYIDDMYSKNALNSYQFYIYQTYQIYTGSQYQTSHQFCAFRVGLNHVPFVFEFEFESPLFKRIFRAPNKRTVAITVNRAFAQCVDLFSCNLSSNAGRFNVQLSLCNRKSGESELVTPYQLQRVSLSGLPHFKDRHRSTQRYQIRH
ncbi:Hypothetical_protein [Hexamita inflata]|uniref:Hypothetical_protein n=1 Tax=Hexamita inflata TaxID=28002 RepID=A0AA86UVG4_9EUKA|nr:Hypothetical protein HINF_LOCUS53911 [Hexamita inflata]